MKNKWILLSTVFTLGAAVVPCQNALASELPEDVSQTGIESFTSAATPEWITTKSYSVCKVWTYYYKRPSGTSPAAGKLYKGTEVRVKSITSEWAKVNIGNHRYYIPVKNLEKC